MIPQKKRGANASPILLGYPDSNQERQDQNLQCYHYTIAPVHCSKAVQSYSFFPVSKYFGIFFALIRLKKRNDSAKRATFNFLTTFVKSD